MAVIRRKHAIIAVLATMITLLYLWTMHSGSSPRSQSWSTEDLHHIEASDYFWTTLRLNYPPGPIRPLPKDKPIRYPKVQYSFTRETTAAREVREGRQHAVKQAFKRCWSAYKQHAWLSDELAPVSGDRKNPFGGWAATLVDSLDTLWIMGWRGAEFEDAAGAAAAIDFTHTDMQEVNVFETNIRYLGGFLSAFDLSGDSRLLLKAIEVGEMLYHAFDTPNHMPVTRWDIHAAMRGELQGAGTTLIAEIGSLSMEFTRLSQLTGNPKWCDAIQRIMDEMAVQQNSTAIPGLWPLAVDAGKMVFNSGSTFTLGAMADSVYEYLPKMSALIGGQLEIYQTMYENAIEAATQHLLFRPMTPTDEDILIAGQLHIKGEDGLIIAELEPQGQHLACFLGGLAALASKLFSRSSDMAIATKLVEGCIWTYKAFPHGIMPETFMMKPCTANENCTWDDAYWRHEVEMGVGENMKGATFNEIVAHERLPLGFTAIPDRRYILRPEAVESLFVLYRTTGRQDLVESAWEMFQAINRSTNTQIANSAVWDVTIPADQKPQPMDSMESFWMGETLKYFYLIFSEPDLINLDEFVFNTEAHPFRRLLR
ncbi:glycoside hydrolase [Xylaria cf. heliscus]|nr:glycoside hydrolase [Xylaria cf. heliscus]